MKLLQILHKSHNLLLNFDKAINNYLRRGPILFLLFVILMVVGLVTQVSAQQAHQKNAIFYDYYDATISAPPKEMHLDPFYTKYTDAGGIPITTGKDVPDVALLVARDVVLHMLSARPDLREYMANHGFRVGVMAVTDSTMDLPEQRDWKKPSFDDKRLTAGEKARYERIKNMTAEEYWNSRARGMGGRYTTCAEENILGYPGEQHKYYGENILVHEFSHSIHSAIHRVEPELAKAIEATYKSAMEKGMWEGQYATTTVAEYWAEGTQFWFNSNYEYKHGDTYVLSSDDLKDYDPTLYELLGKVYPDHHIPMDAFYKHEARVRSK